MKNMTEDDTFRKLRQANFLVLLDALVKIQIERPPLHRERRQIFNWYSDPEFIKCIEDHGWTIEEVKQNQNMISSLSVFIIDNRA